MFRKSHLLPMSPTSFDPRKQLTKADFKIFPRGVLTNIRWSNTIQYRRRVEISLPCIPRSPLFPTAAIVNALRFTASGSNRCSQTFNWSDDRQLIQGFSCGSFTSFLCNHLASLGFDPKLFAGTPFAGVGHHLLTNAEFPLNCLRLSANGTPTPLSSI